jgi:hypothetical protein
MLMDKNIIVSTQLEAKHMHNDWSACVAKIIASKTLQHNCDFTVSFGGKTYQIMGNADSYDALAVFIDILTDVLD